MPRKINLAEAFSRIDDTYSPRIAGEVNEFHVKIVKVQASSSGTTTMRRTSSSWSSRAAF